MELKNSQNGNSMLVVHLLLYKIPESVVDSEYHSESGNTKCLYGVLPKLQVKNQIERIPYSPEKKEKRTGVQDKQKFGKMVEKTAK